MKLKLKKKLVAKSGKVKSVDFHPTFPWILLGLYNGSLSIYDYNTQSQVQYLEVSSFPIRSAKFMIEKSYIICGADDKKLRIFNYNTMEKVKEFEAHNDFIRNIAIHLKDPLFLSSSDDNTIHLYNVDDDFKLVREYNEHNDFVMKLAINPKEYSMFASCSMDKKVKIWSFSATNSQLTLEGHRKGIGAIAFCPLTDKPYLASGGDDNLIKVWDYTNKNCVFTFQGHESNLSSLCFHQELPILISGSEDCTTKFWNVNIGRLEESKVFGYDISWDIAYQNDSNIIGIGADEATIVFQMGSEEPLATFSPSQNKIIYSVQNNVFSINLKQIQSEVKDGEIITIPPKQLGSSELYPTRIEYSPNGRYFYLISNDEFIISTSGIYRNTCIGSCGDISWNENDCFVIKEGTTAIIYKEFKVDKKFKPGFSFDKVFGGPLFALRTEDAVYFYDYNNTIFIRKIDVVPNKIIWEDNRKLVALICDDVTFILKVNMKAIEDYIENLVDNNEKADPNGCDESFEMTYDISEFIVTGFFIGNAFIYENIKNKVNYSLNEKIFSITTLSSKYFLLGYLQSVNRIYLMNKKYQLISYYFPHNFIDYQMAILENNLPLANKILEKIPDNFNDRIINFLEKFGYHELCYKITKNSNQKFSLALKLKKLKDAWEISEKENNQEKFKMTADLALELGEFALAEKAMILGNDYNGLLLLYSSLQDRQKLKNIAIKAKANGQFNVSFSCFFQLNDIDNCLSLLMEVKRYPEAALFCRTYHPTLLNEVLTKWNQKIEEEQKNSRMSISIISPVNENNKEKLEQNEKKNDDFYKEIEKGSVDEMDRFWEIFESYD